MDLEEHLGSVEEAPDPDKVERDFIDAAKDYSEREGISNPAWGEIGIPLPPSSCPVSRF